MAVYEYRLTTYKRGARPRSKRLRELGSGSAAGSSSTIVNVSGGSGENVSVNDHYHENKAALDQIGTDADGYLYLDLQKEVTDDQGNTTIERSTEKVKAGYADVANDLTEDSPVREQFLSRLVDDVAKGNITFEQAIKVLGLATFGGGAEYGEFVKSLYAGKGAGIDADGNAEFESVRVRSYFECAELIVNRLSAIEGDQLLTEADTIDSVDDLGNNCYGLHLKSKWDGYFTAQAVNNVLKGIINTLAAGSGQYYTSWMRVNSVNTTANYIEVTLYPDTETPAGENYPPCELMKIARWGNQTDTTRQGCIYLSSTEGRIVRLTGVAKPIIDAANYGATFGMLPEFLADMDLPIIEGQDYVYARGLIVQDIIRVDYQGRPVSEVVDRGTWSADVDYYSQAVNPQTGVYEISDVWYNGCKYRCARTGTHTAPAWNNTDWAMVEGNPEFTVDFEDTDYIFDPDRFNLTLAIVAKLHNQDITDDILANDVAWTRYSEDADGNERVALDNAWALKRANAGKSIDLTTADCDFNGYVPKVLKFTAAVTLRGGADEEVGTESATQIVKFIRKGDKGDKGEQGAVLRGPQAWSDCANGYSFQAGGDGDSWKDVVIYGDNYYSCVKAHTKTASNYPGSTTANNNGYWQLGDKIELVATKILLATYALVKNLGVEAIEMKDSQGNVKFRAKDGTVQCETGIFRNIDVQSGKVAGFKISGNGLTNDPFDNDAYVVFRNDAMNAFAGIGGNVLPASSGARAVARFENCDTSNHWGLGANYGMLVSSQGARRNIAIGIDGGCISGLALHNTIMTSSRFVNIGETNIICINTENANLKLPFMRLCDDGYLVRVKRLGTAKVNVYADRGETYDDNGAAYPSIPCFIYDKNDTADGTSGVDLNSEGDASDFVWCRDIIRTVGNKTYYGAWIQYKIPCNW